MAFMRDSRWHVKRRQHVAEPATMWASDALGCRVWCNSNSDVGHGSCSVQVVSGDGDGGVSELGRQCKTCDY